jgi:hypothetical protein
MSKPAADDLPPAVVASRGYAAADRVRATIVSGWQSSQVAGWARRRGAAWAGGSWADRRFHAGVLVLVASLTHVMLAVALGEFPGWAFFILPATAAASGVAAIATAAPFVASRR